MKIKERDIHSNESSDIGLGRIFGECDTTWIIKSKVLHNIIRPRIARFQTDQNCRI